METTGLNRTGLDATDERVDCLADERNVMRFRSKPLRLALLAAAMLASLVAPAWAEKRVALVIGNDGYANLPKLQKAANDAQAVGDTLARIGFEVFRARDVGRQGMIDKVAEFTSRIEPGDTALFFYAGHGVAIGGVNYLVPVDAPIATAGAEARVRGASIPEADLVAEIQARGARVAVLVLDACRDNPFPRAGTRSVGNTRGLSDAKPARGVFTVYSAGIGQTALDRLEPNDTNRNSVFTRVFVEQLAKPGLHLGDLAVEVREKVAAIALNARNERGEPDPHEQTPAYYDQTIGGRVFLAGRSVAVEEPKPPAPVVRPDPCALAGEHWRSAEAIGTRAAFEEHLTHFSTCAFAGLARVRLQAQQTAPQPRPQPAPTPQPAPVPGPVAALPRAPEPQPSLPPRQDEARPVAGGIGQQWTACIRADREADAAVAACRALIAGAQLSPRNTAVAHYNIGVALAAKRDLNGAIASFDQALQADQRYAAALTQRGVTLEAAGQRDRAQRDFRAALTLGDANDLEQRWAQATARQRLGSAGPPRR